MTAKYALVLVALAAAFASAGPAHADSAGDCAVMMGRELPAERDADLRVGCICQLAYVQKHVSAEDYAFYTRQLAIAGNADLPDAQRNMGLLQLLRLRNSSASMSHVADAVQAAHKACHLDGWDKSQ